VKNETTCNTVWLDQVFCSKEGTGEKAFISPVRVTIRLRNKTKRVTDKQSTSVDIFHVEFAFQYYTLYTSQKTEIMYNKTV
jgi:hypothetical protein